jgi:hypothetical protein
MAVVEWGVECWCCSVGVGVGVVVTDGGEWWWAMMGGKWRVVLYRAKHYRISRVKTNAKPNLGLNRFSVLRGMRSISLLLLFSRFSFYFLPCPSFP